MGLEFREPVGVFRTGGRSFSKQLAPVHQGSINSFPLINPPDLPSAQKVQNGTRTNDSSVSSHQAQVYLQSIVSNNHVKVKNEAKQTTEVMIYPTERDESTKRKQSGTSSVAGDHEQTEIGAANQGLQASTQTYNPIGLDTSSLLLGIPPFDMTSEYPQKQGVSSPTILPPATKIPTRIPAIISNSDSYSQVSPIPTKQEDQSEELILPIIRRSNSRTQLTNGTTPLAPTLSDIFRTRCLRCKEALLVRLPYLPKSDRAPRRKRSLQR
jgi:hypothetical protein